LVPATHSRTTMTTNIAIASTPVDITVFNIIGPSLAAPS
jgi:hypothetical protein